MLQMDIGLDDTVVLRWNPVKELKVFMSKTRRCISPVMWNPVKELKDASANRNSTRKICKVESGEGIESKDLLG